ncbi:hypothetical protein NLU13_3293 [Sarocladium strictum]|uniref:Uncharacterized protein n=1 Tax=Sarocladium strictum TaxID=5046 RepID=A0AA39LAA1_SARSR|nr:hypothetical protein NLU13_3293 [Sarocladium strictum]
MVSVSSVLSQAKWDELSGRESESGENVRLGNFALFEYAAQGLGGCFQVLWRFKGRHTACIGAYLTITSLAFGFFSQQLITTQVESVASRVSTDAGDVSRATFIQGTGGAIGPPPVGLDTKMAMLNGCASKNTTIDPPQVNCATGNCTWPIIPTLGVCGACVNLTDTIVMEEKNSLMRGNASIPCLAKARGGTELDLCEYTYEIFNVGPGTGQVFKTESTGTSYSARNFIGDLAAIGADRWDGDPRNRTAGECAFWYCVQARNVSVHNGVLKDEIVDTWTEHEQDPQKRLDLNFTNIPRSFDVDPKESYGLGPLWLTALQTYWNETVRGNVTTSIRGDGRKFSDSYVAEGLMHNMGDIKAWGTRFAESMTNQLRSTGVWAQVLDDGTREAAFDASRSTQQYKGLAWKSEVIIRVRWAWISYPASILLLALIYLIVEVFRSARAQDIRPWRNDPLVTLFMTVDDDLKGSIRSGLGDPLGVSRSAGDCRMRVVRDQDGLPIGFHAKQD